MMKRMMAHRNLRHSMNFIVLYGEVNQRKEVSGRLEGRFQRSAGHSCHGGFLQVLLPKPPRLSSQPPGSGPQPLPPNSALCPCILLLQAPPPHAALLVLVPPSPTHPQGPVLSYPVQDTFSAVLSPQPGI